MSNYDFRDSPEFELLNREAIREVKREQTKINAMYAAAPEMLNACKQALDDFVWIEKTVPKSNFQSSILLLKAAIAKAEGRS